MRAWGPCILGPSRLEPWGCPTGLPVDTEVWEQQACATLKCITAPTWLDSGLLWYVYMGDLMQSRYWKVQWGPENAVVFSIPPPPPLFFGIDGDGWSGMELALQSYSL